MFRIPEQALIPLLVTLDHFFNNLIVLHDGQQYICIGNSKLSFGQTTFHRE